MYVKRKGGQQELFGRLTTDGILAYGYLTATPLPAATSQIPVYESITFMKEGEVR